MSPFTLSDRKVEALALEKRKSLVKRRRLNVCQIS
jgi:hypothetical protein